MDPNLTTDFLHIDDLLSEEQRLVTKSVRKFVDSKVLPGIEKHFEEGTFPGELVEEMGSLGLLCQFGPEEYSGAGTDYMTYGLVCRELERGDSGVRSFCSVQSSLVMFPIWKYGSEEQKKKWLPEMAKGKKIGGFGLTEPDFGSNPSGMLTTAKKQGDKYILNGTKRWITNANIADVAVVWAKEDGEIAGFLVEKGAPGLSQIEMKHKMSQSQGFHSH